MNSLILEKNGCLNYRQTADPQVKEDECFIHVRSAGICHSDLFRAFESGAYHYPLIMGHEFCGTIEQKGGDAGNFEKPRQDFVNQFEVVIEACGVEGSFRNSIHYVKTSGNVIWMGNIQSSLTFQKAEVSAILRKEIDICGVCELRLSAF